MEWLDGNAVRLTVPRQERGGLEELGERTGCTVREVEREGLPAFLARFRRRYALLAGLGSLCNFLVIAVNDFRMPVSQSVLQHLSPQRLQQLQSGAIPLYAAADEQTRLLFLGDIIPVPVLGGFASIGDLLLTAGLFFCLMAIMSPDRLPGWWKKG